MARKNLNFTLGYVQQWGLWEALRELLQNWADQRDQSSESRDYVKFDIKKGAETGTVTLKNYDITLSTDTLALGGTGKDSGGFRGKYGEGMKLAWAVLYRLGIERANIDFAAYIQKLSSLMQEKARLEGEIRQARKDSDRWVQQDSEADLARTKGAIDQLETAIGEELKIKVYIRNGEERWIPYVGIDEGMTIPTLHVDTRKLRGEGEDSIEVQVEGITQAEWDMVSARCLFLQKPKTVSLSLGHVLLDPEHASKIYCRDLYVCATPEKSRYGYNFHQLEISRDRGLADPWVVRAYVQHMIEEMTTRESVGDESLDEDILDDIFDAVGDDDTLESKAVREVSQHSRTDRMGNVATSMKKRFVEEHGEDAFPVEAGKTEDATTVTALGMRPVFVTRGMVEALKSEYNLAKMRDSKDVVSVVEDYSELTDLEQQNLSWLRQVFPEVDSEDFQVVRFRGVGVLGSYTGHHCDLGVRALADRRSALKGLCLAFDGTKDRTEKDILMDIILGSWGYQTEKDVLADIRSSRD